MNFFFPIQALVCFTRNGQLESLASTCEYFKIASYLRVFTSICENLRAKQSADDSFERYMYLRVFEITCESAITCDQVTRK